mmetsp:Transcript_14521/g.45638  ORF Transcript_14521/g.45638 Transcript_14521/m.45638 type:complete len:242 (-) Transcript_14521:594-1319(-)
MALTFSLSPASTDKLILLLSECEGELGALRAGLEREGTRRGGGRVVLEVGVTSSSNDTHRQVPTSPPCDSGTRRWAVLTQYAWSESETGVDLRIPITVGTTCTLADLSRRSVTVEVRHASDGEEGALVGRRLVLGYTAGELVVDRCSVRLAKGGTLAKVHLAKADRGWLWTKLTTTPVPDDGTADRAEQQPSLRAALADLYHSSDDATKQSMNRAFSLAHTASPTDLFGQQQLDEWEAAGR